MEQISRRSVLTTIAGLSGAAALTGCSDETEPSLADQKSTTYDYGDDAPSSSSTAEASGGGTTGALTTVDLDSPEDLRNRWAAYVAVWTAADIGVADDHGPRAEDGDWVYVMEVGEWAWLVRFADGRAVLAGQGNPDTRRDDAQEKEARAALLAGAPSWWKAYEKVVPEFNSVGFVLGWDGKKWQRAGAPGARGGFGALTFYLATAERLGEQLARWGSEGRTGYTGSARVAADRVMKAGPKVTAAQLKALGPGVDARRLSAATKAARAFGGKGTH
ncbi:hypothetical protein [Janibacter sp. GS2]|uniref:hypothetical protein n=1 Tax=Janibacter sp. GS2 TaxID=3442646 RepID=UPI003EB8D09F